jgi:hypothetical protein
MERGYPEGFIDYVKSKIASEEYRPFDRYNGRFACAIFVSSVLKKFGLIDDQHDTVKVVVHNLNLVEIPIDKTCVCKWKEVDLKDIEPGDLIIYAKKKGSGAYHIAIFIGDGLAIGNSWKSRTPIKHPIDSPTVKGIIKRKIEHVFALLKEEKCQTGN